jgi:CRISPR-associated protein Csx3
MAGTYRVAREGDVLTVGFGTPAENTQIVQDAIGRLEEMVASGELAGGDLIKVNGPASLPVGMVICHALAHRFGAVAVLDPKLGGYVVAVSHDPARKVGDFIPL